jgi:tRNA pseudouridine13 synthase
MTIYSLLEWPHAYGGPSATADFKSVPDDFVVEEILGFEPEGSGEHVFLYLEKIGENTEYIARLLARHAEVRQRDIGYAGLKDRHARTRQWFSVWLPGKADPDWQALQSDNLKILQSLRHPRKLKRGVLDGNRFEITLRNWHGDREQCERQLQKIQLQGYPNYFGEQRFGHHGQNLDRCLEMFAGRRVKPEQRSLYLSAARSYLFNLILAKRVEAGNWNLGLAGDVFKLDGNNSQFHAEVIDEVLRQRLNSGDIHPTAALFGKGTSPVSADALQQEQQVFAEYPQLCEGLLKAGLEQDRRAMRVKADQLAWSFDSNDVLRLEFVLPAGSYATGLLREIVDVNDGNQPMTKSEA